ncbi:hypothetical protein Mal48_37310 [Thalassoglobus polymorphus]|uniref:Uncharacterized protein n=1 Tax=Thalassoglobus polymorphus TaxID=2527994 RepID=A0A517QS61_9PLAN|nr:hypothetical protein Mal48_37310 [Thalassoglobus polymorphus]
MDCNSRSSDAAGKTYRIYGGRPDSRSTVKKLTIRSAGRHIEVSMKHHMHLTGLRQLTLGILDACFSPSQAIFPEQI